MLNSIGLFREIVLYLQVLIRKGHHCPGHYWVDYSHVLSFSADVVPEGVSVKAGDNLCLKR